MSESTSAASFDLTITALTHDVNDGAQRRRILELDRLTIGQGEQVVLQGVSGSGKTTFLRLISGIVRAQSGSICWGNTAMEHLSEIERDRWRGRYCGFLFQDFGLLDGLSAIDNVLLPLTFSRRTIEAAQRARARELLEQLNVHPSTRAQALSRGEMQRTALARLLLGAPRVILADEPTASLDAAHGRQVVGMLREAARNLNATLLVVSHDRCVVEGFARQLTLAHGRITEQSHPDLPDVCAGAHAAPSSDTTSGARP